MKLNEKQRLPIVLVLAIGAVLAGLILGTGKPQPQDGGHEHEHGHGAEESAHAEEAGGGEHDAAGPQKGPHGGQLFIQDGYGLEVVFEAGAESQFRLYTYEDGTPLPPAASRVSLTLERLGRPPQSVTFTPEKDYLKSDAVVEEPHSFTMTIDAMHANKAYRFARDQVEARVSMSDARLAQNKIEVLTAGPARIRSTLQLIGEIRFNEDRLVHVVPRLTGIVQSVAANAGDRVRKGQLLAVIASQSLSDQRSELLAAQKRLALAQATFEREKELWEDKISAEQDYLQAGSALQEAQIAVDNTQQKLVALGGDKWTGSNLTRYEVRAPISGVVIEKHISLGEAVKEDVSVFVIADLSTVWAEMTIYAKDLNTVRVGQKATVKAAAFESESNGTVSYVGPLVGEQSRTAKARLVLPNPQGVWRPGLPVNIELIANEFEVPVAVSVEAIQSMRDWNVVFGRYGTNFEARPVELGRSDGRHVEIVKGLHAGEQYAAKNSFLIKADLGKAGASHEH